MYYFKALLKCKVFNPTLCETPLADIEDSIDELTYIIENKRAYDIIIEILMTDCKSTNDAGALIYDLLSVLKSSSKDFKDTAVKYDRYMGNEFSVSHVIRSVYSYGQLSGLVDFYNMEEGKDVR